MKIKQFVAGVIATALLLASSVATAGFPDDFSDVIWIDPDISSFPVTSTISANVSGSRLQIQDTKRSVWPRRFHTDLQSDCCNRSLWIFIKLDGQWYAATFEYMRFSQIDKLAEAVNGGQIKRAPFSSTGYEWHPAEGEVYGFMTSGMARFNLNNLNVSERSNISLYRWEVGPTDNVDFEEAVRGSNGRPIGDGGTVEPVDSEEPGVCVEPDAPEVENNTHIYDGSAIGNLVVSGPLLNENANYSQDITITVMDDRSLSFRAGGESFSTQIQDDGSFTGRFIIDILGQCEVEVLVNGTVNGTSSSGTASSSDSCLGNTAELTASYSAISTTVPSYIDQRPATARPARVCASDVTMPPILNLLLDQ